VALAEYQRWRALLAQNPDVARQRVTAALQSVRDDQQPRAIVWMGKLSAQARIDFMQRTLRDRGLLVWRTLETVIDRERVDRALLLYQERYQGKLEAATGFRKACEEISGRDLRWFFDYYVAGTQLPRITLRRITGSAPNEVAGEIIVSDAPPAYQVRVELRLYTSAGTIEHSVATNGAVTPFTVTARDPVTRIALDPDSRILRRLDSSKP